LETIAGKEHDNELDKARHSNNILWRVILILVAALSIAIFGFLNARSSSIIKVKLPFIQETLKKEHIVVGLNAANITYYELWGRDVIRIISNFDEENISEKLDFATNEMRPSNALEMMPLADIFKYQVVSNRMKNTFTFTKVTPFTSQDHSTGGVTIEGIARTTVGKKELPPKECIYEVNFEFLENVFYIKNYGTNCFNEDNPNTNKGE